MLVPCGAAARGATSNLSFSALSAARRGSTYCARLLITLPESAPGRGREAHPDLSGCRILVRTTDPPSAASLSIRAVHDEPQAAANVGIHCRKPEAPVHDSTPARPGGKQVTALLVFLVVALGQDPPKHELPGSHRLEGARATVWFLPPDSGQAIRVLRALEAAPPLPGLPADVPSEVVVVLAPDEATFGRLAGGQAPDWSAGFAVPARAMIVMPAYSPAGGGGWDDARALRHEWAHIGLHQYLSGLRVPRWFSEGYAQWASGGWDWSEGWKLRIALVRDRNPLSSLTFSWPREEARARTAYLLSATTIEYLVVQSGHRGLAVLLERWRNGGSFEQAFRTTFGLTATEFERDWRRYVEDRYGWLFVLSHSAVFWLFLSVVLVAMVAVRRQAKRERLARLRAQDFADRPSVWISDAPSAQGRGPEPERSEYE